MEIFSSGVTVAQYLTEIEVGEGTFRWKDDINTTIQHLFLEKVHNYIIVNYQNYLPILLFFFIKCLLAFFYQGSQYY
jgi:hypothetical protein